MWDQSELSKDWMKLFCGEESMNSNFNKNLTKKNNFGKCGDFLSKIRLGWLENLKKVFLKDP